MWDSENSSVRKWGKNMERHPIKKKQRTGHRPTQAWTRTDSRKAGEQNIVQAKAVNPKK